MNTKVALENVLNFIYQCPQVFGQMIDQYSEVIQQLFQSTLGMENLTFLLDFENSQIA